MGRHLVVVCVLFTACSGGSKKQADKPISKSTAKPDKPTLPPESEADRETKRRALAAAIVPEGSACLPVALKDDNAPRLEIAAVGKDAIVCALDTDRTRLLGPIACWKLDLKTGEIPYRDPSPLPGRGYDVMLDDRCARGYCLPKDAKLGGAKLARIAFNLDGNKVAVLVGDDVHIFNVANKEHESSFTIRGEKGVTNDPIAIHFVGEAILVEGADQGPYSAVWVFKSDGTQVGPITAIGAKDDKPMSTWHGSFSILDADRVVVAERGYETVTVYEINTGKRTKITRKVAKPTCKPDELDAFWHDGDKVTDRCKESMNKLYGHLMGATTIAGSTSLLALLRNDRLGELAVLDARSLVEKRTLKMPWCDKSKPAGGGKAGKADKADDSDAAPPADKKKDTTRGPKTKARSSDPDEGGQ